MTNKYQKNMPTTSSGAGLAVPEAVTIAMSEIAEDMREGLLALAVGAGLQVMASLMEADVAAACGPRGKHDPGRTAVRPGSCLPRGPHAAATSASISEAITCKPAPTARASRPSRISSAISLIAIVTASGTASPAPLLVVGMFFWDLLVMVVPFLVVSWRTPNTYPTGGVRRGTATQIPRDQGQPPLHTRKALCGCGGEEFPYCVTQTTSGLRGAARDLWVEQTVAI